jgi:hypothetical protein
MILVDKHPLKTLETKVNLNYVYSLFGTGSEHTLSHLHLLYQQMRRTQILLNPIAASVDTTSNFWMPSLVVRDVISVFETVI